MSQFKVYIKPFDADGLYLADYIDITNDVIKLGAIQQSIDNTDFNVGVVKNNGVTLTLRNDHGRFGEPDTFKSIFKTKRKNSIIKITYDKRDYPLICGFFNCGEEIIYEEIEVFRGLLNEVTSVSDIALQNAQFTILGFDSILNETAVPFASISDGDSLSEILLACLDQAPFNEFVTVDALNINVANDVVIDNKAPWENKTVGQVLANVLLAGNSVLYIKDLTVYVSGRSPSTDVLHTFYGQGSSYGIEDIIKIPIVRDGLNRMFNQWTWTDTALVAKSVGSIDVYGIKAKNMKLDVIEAASTATIQSILDANRDEFSEPRVELELHSPIDVATLALNILDKISIDYPTVYVPSDNNPLPRYGLSNYGVIRYPYGQWSLTIDSEREFKILGKKIDPNNRSVIYTLREIIE